jgi:hypothetical protein
MHVGYIRTGYIPALTSMQWMQPRCSLDAACPLPYQELPPGKSFEPPKLEPFPAEKLDLAEPGAANTETGKVSSKEKVEGYHNPESPTICRDSSNVDVLIDSWDSSRVFSALSSS